MKKILVIALALISISTLNAVPRKVSLHAHQGEFYYAPPNSAPAVKKAFDSGSKYVEFDVAITDSGEMICVHWDHELKHQWGINKPLAKITRQDIDNARPTPAAHRNKPEFMDMKLTELDDVLAVTPRDGYLIVDIKRGGKDFDKKFDAAVMKAGLQRSHMYLPLFALEGFRKISKEYNKAYLTRYLHKPSPEKNLSAEDMIEMANKHPLKKYIKIISIGQAGHGEEFFKRLNDKDYFRKIRAAGYLASAWTTDDVKVAKKLIEEYEVDILYTNRAESMRKDLGLKPERRSR